MTGAPKGPGRPRDVAKEKAIIRAAQMMFLRHGFDGASVDAIADAAGVAKATVYARFRDKEGLLRVAIAEKCAQFVDHEDVEQAARRSLRATLTRFARQFLALVTDKDALAMHALMMEAGKSGPQMPQLFFDSAVTPTCRRLGVLLEAEAARGRLRFDDTGAAVWRFLGMVKAQDHMRAMLGLPMRPKAEIERYIDSCVEAFLAAHEV